MSQSSLATQAWVTSQTSSLATQAQFKTVAIQSVVYATNVVAYNDGLAQWAGFKVWMRNNVVTVSGAFQLNAAFANAATIATLPAGITPPPGNIQSGTFIVHTDGTIAILGAQSSGFITSGTVTYAT